MASSINAPVAIMIIGILWTIAAAVMLGFYAPPSKFIKGYEAEDTWDVFWLLAMFVVPTGATATLVSGLADTYAQVSAGTFAGIIFLSFLGGLGNL